MRLELESEQQFNRRAERGFRVFTEIPDSGRIDFDPSGIGDQSGREF